MSKQDFRQIYFCEFKLGRIAGQIARNSYAIWVEESISECTVQRSFRKYILRELDLENKEGHSRPSVVDDDHPTGEKLVVIPQQLFAVWNKLVK